MHPKAGQSPTHDMLVSIPGLMSAYYTEEPEPENPLHQVYFGTSGHRGKSTACSFNEVHILAICQAICDYRKENDISGPLFIGKDTHALSEAAFITAIEVLAANEIQVRYQAGQGYTPTPVISHAIIGFNRTHSAQADGLIITPSHNPPTDGGIKYNPPHGGPAEKRVTDWITKRANALILNDLEGICHVPFRKALRCENVKPHDYIAPYVEDLVNVVNMDAIRSEGLTIAVDPMGGAGLDYWDPIADKYGLNISIVNPVIDPGFSFMTLDRDGCIRMDCSSPWVMQRLIHLKDKFDLAIGNDPDFDRHGIVIGSQGLMKANDYLSVCADYLFRDRKGWSQKKKLGKTVVTTSLMDRLANDLGVQVMEAPVGFKWYEPGLSAEEIGFACEESAGATFLRRNGRLWTTDKDGFIAGLLAGEIMAITGRDLSDYYRSITDKYGAPSYSRAQIAASPEQLRRLSEYLVSGQLKMPSLAGERILKCFTEASGNHQFIGGVKLVTENGWVVIRPSGTESAYKIYAESFRGEEHVKAMLDESCQMVSDVIE